MNIIKVVMILFVIVVTIVIEYVILTGKYDTITTVYEKLPDAVKFVDAIEKGKKCEMKGNFVDYMGRRLESNVVDCTTCIQYLSMNTDGFCQSMQYDGSACSTFGGSRPCPKKV
jgi:uncharacterized ion transporter superfamily protein YfcC